MFPNGASATMADKIEETFGLEAFYDKEFACCLDTTKLFRLSLSDFLSMVVGERVSVRMKNGIAITIPWRCALLFMGNQFP